MLSICHAIWSLYWHWHRVRTTFWTLFGIERNCNGPNEVLMDLEYCKYTVWILVAWILALIIGLGLKFELYEIVINCVGLTIGAILLWILLIRLSGRDVFVPAYTLTLHNASITIAGAYLIIGLTKVLKTKNIFSVTSN